MPTEKKINILYFAQLRESRGCHGEDLQTTANTPRELYHDMQERYNWPFAEQQLRVAVNEQLVAWETSLKDGDTVVFLTPVSGG